jgi:hypothetical protein
MTALHWRDFTSSLKKESDSDKGPGVALFFGEDDYVPSAQMKHFKRAHINKGTLGTNHEAQFKNIKSKTKRKENYERIQNATRSSSNPFFESYKNISISYDDTVAVVYVKDGLSVEAARGNEFLGHWKAEHPSYYAKGTPAAPPMTLQRALQYVNNRTLREKHNLDCREILSVHLNSVHTIADIWYLNEKQIRKKLPVSAVECYILVLSLIQPSH